MKTVRCFQSQESKISAHFVVPRNIEEQVIQLVDVKHKAWHAGRAVLWKKGDVNLNSIGIQLVGTKESGYTDWQYEASAGICAKLIELEPRILLNRIVGHDAIAERENGPGPAWNWSLFFDCSVRKMYGLEAIERV